jgi:hypothetical protein
MFSFSHFFSPAGSGVEWRRVEEVEGSLWGLDKQDHLLHRQMKKKKHLEELYKFYFRANSCLANIEGIA